MAGLNFLSGPESMIKTQHIPWAEDEQMLQSLSFNLTHHLMAVQCFCSWHFSFPIAQVDPFGGKKLSSFLIGRQVLVLYFKTIINTIFSSSASPSVTCKQITRVLKTGSTTYNLSLTTYFQKTEILLSKASSLVLWAVHDIGQRSCIWQSGWIWLNFYIF